MTLTANDSLQNDKTFWLVSKLKEFAEDKINRNKKLDIDLDRVENIMEKEKMLVSCIFPVFYGVFKSLF